jgi:hypothetical protein
MRQSKVGKKKPSKPVKGPSPAALRRASRVVDEAEWDRLGQQRDQLLETCAAIQLTARACETLAKIVSRFEADEFRSVGLLSVKSGERTEGQRVELLLGESRRFEFTLEGDGQFDVNLTNMGRALCFMTQVVYLGRCLWHGSFVRAYGEGKSGQFVSITVERT